MNLLRNQYVTKNCLSCKKILLILLTFSCFLAISLFYLSYWTYEIPLPGQEGKGQEIQSREVKRCVVPQLLEDDPVMVRSVRRLSLPKCSYEEWLRVYNGHVYLSTEAKRDHLNITCDYYPLVRKGDYDYIYRKPIRNIPDGFQMVSDFFKGVCKDIHNVTNVGIYSGVHHSEDRAKRSENADPLSLGFHGMSIAILGFDSMSRMSWHRRLKETRSYFKDNLGGIELESHNIVGDGTTAVMFPMLTGKFEWELPECR
ncbi:hypothetical protein ElyMa_005138600 [Elysia marginata]|uniref:Methyltransferase domain-containing protein n=1 Tax=Elysia marginata TaxID=1093978 RepID=A0AAV4JRT6_9GAST|nr:hypothetical protein ElyMa_005138600 [Elysia marginata]